MAALSLLGRRTGLGSLGLRIAERSLVWKMWPSLPCGLLFQIGVTKPIANHLSGDEQDLSGFERPGGSVGMLALSLVFGWTLAGFGEELAYRSYLLTRLREASAVGPCWLWLCSFPRCSSDSPTASSELPRSSCGPAD